MKALPPFKEIVIDGVTYVRKEEPAPAPTTLRFKSGSRAEVGLANPGAGLGTGRAVSLTLGLDTAWTGTNWDATLTPGEARVLAQNLSCWATLSEER